jgi:NAD(P)-dependent dehydrogenase (short-subunit alcohol dehydrogenase family)
MKRLQDKVALITGAARGIGLAIARRFSEEGAFVVVNDLQQVDAEKVAIPLGGIGLAADVSSSAAVRGMFEELARRVGRLDVLVNNAGIAGSGLDPSLAAAQREKQLRQVVELAAAGRIETHLDAIMNTTDEQWRTMLAIHLDGTFYCTREALQLMTRQASGAIINMSSVMGTSGGAGGRHPRLHALGRTRARHAQHPRERHRPRLDRYRHDRPARGHQGRDRPQHPDGPPRRARRHRLGRGLPRQRRGEVRDGSGAVPERRMVHESVMQPDPYRTPAARLESGAGTPERFRIWASAAGALTAVLTIVATVLADGSEAVVGASLFVAATFGGFVAAWLGRAHHALHGSIAGGSVLLVTAVSLWYDGGAETVSDPHIVLLGTLQLGAGLVGSWIARTIGRVSQS